MNRKIKEQILELRSQGKSYKEISETLNCSRGSISYHCGDGQKNKSKLRQRKNKKVRHPYYNKLHCFKGKRRQFQKNTITKNKLNQVLVYKIYTFRRNNLMSNEITLEEILNKLGENPTCYLTGDQIDIYDTRSYHFDHIIPISKGGTSSIDNLGFCTREANFAKRDMTDKDFIAFCKKVVDHNLTKC